MGYINCLYGRISRYYLSLTPLQLENYVLYLSR